MKLANVLGFAGLTLTLVASVLGLVFQVGHLNLVDVVGWMQIVAFLLVVVGAIRGSRWWILSLFLVAAGGYLWLLEQGH